MVDGLNINKANKEWILPNDHAIGIHKYEYVKPNLIPLLTLENYELPLIKKYVHAKFILKRIKSDSKFFD